MIKISGRSKNKKDPDLALNNCISNNGIIRFVKANDRTYNINGHIF